MNLIVQSCDLVQMESTYRTNRYKTPLRHVVGRTNTNNSSAILFALWNWRRQSTMCGHCSHLKISSNRFFPMTIVTDCELVIVNAIADVFSAANHLLCAWHVSKNIAAHCKAHFLVTRSSPHNLLTDAYRSTTRLQNHIEWVLNELFEHCEPLRTSCAIDHAVVARKSRRNHLRVLVYL